MAKYTTTMTVWHGGQPHHAGASIELDKAAAEPLLASGAIEPDTSESDAKAEAEAAAKAEADAKAKAEAEAAAKAQPKAKG